MNQPFIYTQKELAARIGRSREYIRHMCRRGFVLPATEQEAVVFLRQHPKPCACRRHRSSARV